MSNTRQNIPLQSAIAGWTVARVGGSLVCMGRSDLTLPTVPSPIYRGLTR